MSVPIPGYPNPPPPGLNEAVEAAGYVIRNEGGVWVTNVEASVAPILAIVAGYDPLPYVRALRIAEAREVYSARFSGGVTTAAGIAVDTSPENLTFTLALLCAASDAPPPTSFVIKDRNGVFSVMTPASARTLASNVNVFWQQCAAGEKAAVDAINAGGQTWQQVMAINIASFFPANS